MNITWNAFEFSVDSIYAYSSPGIEASYSTYDVLYSRQISLWKTLAVVAPTSGNCVQDTYVSHVVRYLEIVDE